MNLLFIVNPIAGHGKNSAINSIPYIEEFCRSHNVEYHIKKTAYEGHATLIVEEALFAIPKYDAVVSVGGDGTLLEVANGLIGSDILLGIIPAGTGNDFARAMGIPRGIKDALGYLTRRKTRLIDVAKLENIFFVNVASIGFDAEIIRDILKIKRFVPGRASYYLAVLVKFFTFRFKDVIIHMDGARVEARVLLVAIANGTYYGGGMKVNPKGVLEDGYLDVIVISHLPRYKIPFLLYKFVKGTYQDLSCVKTFRCREISIESKDALVINADGDILGSTPARFSIVPSSLKVIGA